jgi:hypothetical protein
MKRRKLERVPLEVSSLHSPATRIDARKPPQHLNALSLDLTPFADSRSTPSQPGSSPLARPPQSAAPPSPLQGERESVTTPSYLRMSGVDEERRKRRLAMRRCGEGGREVEGRGGLARVSRGVWRREGRGWRGEWSEKAVSRREEGGRGGKGATFSICSFASSPSFTVRSSSASSFGCTGEPPANARCNECNSALFSSTFSSFLLFPPTPFSLQHRFHTCQGPRYLQCKGIVASNPSPFPSRHQSSAPSPSTSTSPSFPPASRRRPIRALQRWSSYLCRKMRISTCN